MTEKEKRDMGLLYDANYDKELVEQRINCQCMCHEYNLLSPANKEKREELIRKIIGNHKENFVIEQPFRCDVGSNITIGNNFYSNYNLVILDGAKVTFGDNVFIGPDCGFYTAGHPLNVNLRNRGLEYARPITVGHNVWFGGGVKVMPGVTIGNNCVIGSGSVVTKDIPQNTVAAGNPCKVIRVLTDEELFGDK